MSEPGLDLHEWQSRWASIEEDLRDDPGAALPQLVGIVEEMLRAKGYDVDDPVQLEGDEREIVASYRSARETAERAEAGGASRADVEIAIEDLRAIFDTFATESS
jgi:hypothetical protein